MYIDTFTVLLFGLLVKVPLSLLFLYFWLKGGRANGFGWWGAALLSLLVFAGWHAYQGWTGVLKTGIFGAIYTVAVAAFDSLWPAIALHAVTDIGSGAMAWLALREPLESITNRQSTMTNAIRNGH